MFSLGQSSVKPVLEGSRAQIPSTLSDCYLEPNGSDFNAYVCFK